METRSAFSSAPQHILQVQQSRMPEVAHRILGSAQTTVSSTSHNPRRSQTRAFPKPTFSSINYRMIPDLRALNTALFPVAYNDKFYADVLATKEYAHAAYIEGQLAGAICCRRESNSWDSTYRVYVMTLGVRPQYRRLGIASTLIQRVISHARTDPNCSEIALHVQTSNHGALGFYDRLGFVRQQLVPDYYLQLNPTSAYFLTYPCVPPAEEEESGEDGSESEDADARGVFREGVDG